MPSPTRIVVLISGSGTNLQSIINAIKTGAINATIVAVISNKAGVQGLERARKENIPALTVSHQQFTHREHFDQALMQKIDEYTPDLIVLAGFMRILSKDLVNHYRGKMINIHPSLLPKYQGLHTHRRALEADDRQHGCSIHFVTEELDGGPVIAQSSCEIQADDTEQTLRERVQQLEHKLYPQVIKDFCEGKITLS
ncbi:MAG TPA: phosphoribosylglycinamide formyltransferase [Aeromonadales bacterium]|nr:phosphoribosylglycinamide formyltransferase [Aeromonadales bacterium]